MNILIFSWRGIGHPDAGGAEIVTHEHAKAWVRAGHTVTIFTASYEGSRAHQVVDGVLMLRQGYSVFLVQVRAFLWYLFFTNEKFDIVVDQFHGIPFFTPLFVRVKKLAFIHEVAKEVWRFNPWPWPFSYIPAALGWYLEPLIFKLFYRGIPFMTVSNSTKHDLMEWGIDRGKVTVIHNGVLAPKFKRGLQKKSRKTIIFLGVLSRDKGVEVALSVFCQLDKLSPNYRFWVVGKSNEGYMSYLKRIVRNFGIEEKIRFFGFVSQKKKFYLLARASVLVNPSVREGWGLVNIEANLSGTPVVGLNVAGVRDSVIHGKTGVLCRDSKSMARVIFKLLNDESKYKEMVGACVQWGRSFKWSKSTRLSLRLIQSLR